MKKIIVFTLSLLTLLVIAAPAQANRLTPQQQEASKVIRAAEKYFTNAYFNRIRSSIGRRIHGEIARCWSTNIRSMPSTTPEPPLYASDALYFLAYPKHLKTYVNNYTRLARELTRLRLRDATLRKYSMILRRIAAVYKRYATPSYVRQTSRLDPCVAMQRWVASGWRHPQVRRFGMNYNRMMKIVSRQASNMRSLRAHIISLGFSPRRVNIAIGP